MSHPDRIRRPRPERTRPHRSAAALFGAALPGAPFAGGEGAPASGPADVVSRSVELGYRVIDEYLRQGERVARRFGEGDYPREAMARDGQDVLAQMGRLAGELLALWMQAFQAAGAGAPWTTWATMPTMPPLDTMPPMPTMPFPGFAPPPPAAATSGTAAAAAPPSGEREATRITVQVVSPHPAEVALDLRPGAGERAVALQALRAAEPGKPKIATARVGWTGPRDPLAFVIEVPEGQPPGVYNGLLVEEESGRPVGTVTLCIKAA